MLGKEIIIETLKQIQRDRVTATPEVYAKTFCAVAKKAGLDLEECKPALKHIARLPEPLRTQAGDRNIEQMDDLMAFIIGAIRRGAGAPKKDAEEIILVVTDLLAKAMTPSFAGFDSSALSETLSALEDDPHRFLDLLWRQKILGHVVDRIRFDRARIASEAGALKIGVENLRDLVASMRTATRSRRGDIGDFSKTIDEIEPESATKEVFAELKSRLAALAAELGSQAEGFESQLESQQAEIDRLRSQVDKMNGEMERLVKENAEDYLTGAQNKRALDKAFMEFECEYERSRKEYSALFFDIDFFKRINDSYGHECGDKVLGALGVLLKNAIPSDAIVGRYGGEEFVAIVRMNLADAAQLAEKIRSEVEKSRFSYRQQTISMTVSCGVASRSETDGIDAVLRSADERLYAAKQGGRNMVKIKKN